MFLNGRSCLVLLSVLVLLGCQSTEPIGSTGSRIDPYRSTPADTASNKASIPALLEFSSQTASRLAYDLANIDEIRNANQKMVLELGTIANHTATPSSDFEAIQKRVRGQLLKSDVVRKKFDITMDPARMDAEMARLGATGAAPARYDSNITYVLQGDFHEANRGGRRQYYFQFMLTHLGSRRIVQQFDYDLAQVSQ